MILSPHPPPPLRLVPCIIYRANSSAFSSLVDSHQAVSGYGIFKSQLPGNEVHLGLCKSGGVLQTTTVYVSSFTVAYREHCACTVKLKNISCGIEDSVETQPCELCVILAILRLRVLLARVIRGLIHDKHPVKEDKILRFRNKRVRTCVVDDKKMMIAHRPSLGGVAHD